MLLPTMALLPGSDFLWCCHQEVASLVGHLYCNLNIQDGMSLEADVKLEMLIGKVAVESIDTRTGWD